MSFWDGFPAYLCASDSFDVALHPVDKNRSTTGGQSGPSYLPQWPQQGESPDHANWAVSLGGLGPFKLALGSSHCSGYLSMRPFNPYIFPSLPSRCLSHLLTLYPMDLGDIHYGQYIHPIGSNQPLWAAGESIIYCLLTLQWTYGPTLLPLFNLNFKLKTPSEPLKLKRVLTAMGCVKMVAPWQ